MKLDSTLKKVNSFQKKGKTFLLGKKLAEPH